MNKQKWRVEVYPEAGMRVVRLQEDADGEDLQVIRNRRDVEWGSFVEPEDAVRKLILGMLHLREVVLLGRSPS